MTLLARLTHACRPQVRPFSVGYRPGGILNLPSRDLILGKLKIQSLANQGLKGVEINVIKNAWHDTATFCAEKRMGFEEIAEVANLALRVHARMSLIKTDLASIEASSLTLARHVMKSERPGNSSIPDVPAGC